MRIGTVPDRTCCPGLVRLIPIPGFGFLVRKDMGCSWWVHQSFGLCEGNYAIFDEVDARSSHGLPLSVPVFRAEAAAPENGRDQRRSQSWRCALEHHPPSSDEAGVTLRQSHHPQWAAPAGRLTKCWWMRL